MVMEGREVERAPRRVGALRRRRPSLERAASSLLFPKATVSSEDFRSPDEILSAGAFKPEEDPTWDVVTLWSAHCRIQDMDSDRGYELGS